MKHHPEYQQIIEDYKTIFRSGKVPEDLGIEYSCSIVSYLCKKYAVNRYTLAVWIREENLPKKVRQAISLETKEKIVQEFQKLIDSPIPQDLGPCANLVVYLSRKYQVTYATVSNITRPMRIIVGRPNTTSKDPSASLHSTNSEHAFYFNHMSKAMKKKVLAEALLEELEKRIQFVKKSLQMNDYSTMLLRIKNLTDNRHVEKMIFNLVDLDRKE